MQMSLGSYRTVPGDEVRQGIVEAEIREKAVGGKKVLEWFETEITDRDGDVVAKAVRAALQRKAPVG